MDTVSLTVAFVGGVVSFLSPCILPLIPGYLSYLAGSATSGAGIRQRDIFLASVFFVLGFAVVFSLIGVLLNTILEPYLYGAQTWLARIGGAIIIFFGLYLTRIIRVPFLDQKHGLEVRQRFSSRHLTSFAFGAAFAAGWSPCVGAVLGTILALAASSPGNAFALLLSYSLGLGLPFLLVGIFTAQASALINRYALAVSRISVVFGVLLIIIGIFVFTGEINRLASFELLNSFLLR